MKRTLLILAVTSSLFTACGSKQETKKIPATAYKSITVKADIVNQTFEDAHGEKLDLEFDNTKDLVTLTFKGETSSLASQKPASGIWYKNQEFELSGKGNDIQLLRNGKLVFEHHDDSVELIAKNDKGETLNMTFNNSTGKVKVYLNGGEQIEMNEQKSASGIWYKNEHFELTGKGNHYDLLKDGKSIFKN
jgi:membrane-bound inhibitor of C-type lysozyme